MQSRQHPQSYPRTLGTQPLQLLTLVSRVSQILLLICRLKLEVLPASI